MRAGAGAGKTYALVEKVTEYARAFKASQGRWPRVVATTFTRKATQELRERLMRKALTDSPDLAEFVNSRSNLVVSTIHGVLDLYLKRHGSVLGVDPGYKVIGDGDASRTARRVLRDLLFADPDCGELLERFNFNRLSELARRLDDLQARSPEARPCGLEDFAAMARLRFERLALDLDEAGARIREETQKPDWLAMADGFHGLAASLRKEPVDPDGRAQVLERSAALRKARWSEKNPPVEGGTNEVCEDVLKRARALGEPLLDPAVWSEFAAEFTKFDRLGQRFSIAFRAAKVARGELEISDLESLAMRCARASPESAGAFAAEWDFWLVDEYQDTAPFQVELLRLLTKGAPTYVVGDPQQSIYLFRGARSEVFAAKENEILEAGGTRGLLARNYRSRPELLEFFNDFFAGFRPPFAKMEANLATADGAPDAAFDPSAVVATFYVANEPLADADPRGPEDEWLSLVRRAQDLIGAGASPEDVCVLARTNRDLTEAALWLSRYGLPTHVHASSGFYERRETLDALGFLKFLANPHDDSNAVELLRAPWFRVSDDDLAGLTTRLSPPASRWSAILADERACRWPAAVTLAGLLERKNKSSLTAVFREGLVELGFIDFSHLHDMSGRRESNVWKLVAQLQQEESLPGFNPLAFVSGRLRDVMTSDGKQDNDAVAALEPDRINLMTIHASKGLQFKHVLLPRMHRPARLTRMEEFTFDEDRRIWSFRVPMGEALENQASLAEKSWLEKFNRHELLEHDRVLYVALTRAKDSVYLSWTSPAPVHSWAAGLRWPLAPGTSRRGSYSFEVLPSIPSLPRPSVTAGVAASREPRPPFAADVSGAARSASVTDLLERAAAKRTGLLSAGGLGLRMRVAQEGVSMHRLMELLQNPSQDQLKRMARKWFPRREAEALAAIERVQAMREPPLLQLIRDGSVEWGFAFRDGKSIVEGQIDLWGRDEGGVLWVVDYKSGSPARKAQAFAQLSLYALALRKGGFLRADERARLAAVYPFSGEAFVEAEPDADRVRAEFEL